MNNPTLNILTFERLTIMNVARCTRWHPKGIEDWTPQRWFLATVGELGEVANALKKLWRVEAGMVNISEPSRQISSRVEAIKAIAAEIADTVIYLNLFATRIGLKLSNERVNNVIGPGVKRPGTDNAELILISANRHLALAMNDYQIDDSCKWIQPKLIDCYCSLRDFATMLDIDLAAAVIEKFNETSAKYGFPERL